MEQEKRALMNMFVDELPVLRMKLRIKQETLSSAIGISRQTLSAIESKKREPIWNTFLSIFMFFDANEETRKMMETWGDFSERVKRILIYSRENDADNGRTL
jgi:DNA-binding XRE family transcriptional regulator